MVNDRTAAADRCPQCKDDNSEPWGLCDGCLAGEIAARAREEMLEMED